MPAGSSFARLRWPGMTWWVRDPFGHRWMLNSR